MYNEESASLILRTGDLPQNSSNNVGSADLYYTNMTWNNINLRSLLGEMYDKYDKFNLVPVVFTTGQGTTSFGTNEDDRIFQIYISGLPFTNNVYDTNLKSNTNLAICNTMKFVRSQTVTINGGVALTFTKNQELVNINIFYKRVSPSGTPPNYNVVSTAGFPHVSFLFKIYGIKKTERVEDLNSSRIFEK